MNQVDFLDAPKKAQFPGPRTFQEIAHRELRTGYLEGHQRQVLMAPTGAGKTYLGLRICYEAIQRNKRSLFICDRKTLINQTSETATRYGMPLHGIIQASNPRFALHRNFQIASAQTLAIRGVRDDYDVIVVDECHTLIKATTNLIESTKAAVIGLSATPFTKGLGKIYSRVINAATMDELVKQEVLTRFDAFSCVRPDMTDAKTDSKGEWTAKEAGARGMGIVGDVVREWFDRSEGLKTIVFGSTITHCEELRRQFSDAGVRAELFTSHTKDNEREDILAEYRRPDSRIRVLISVDALAKGFDVPDVECVCDARPLRKSLSTFIQMLGRGLRSFEGKERCVFLDFSGNIIRMADDFSDIYFNGIAELDSGERLDKEIRKDEEHEPKPCPQCGATPMGRRCIKCGFEPVRKSLIEHEHGKSQALDILGTKRNSYAKDEFQLFSMIATSERERAERRGHGNPKGATAHRYRELMGKWPPREFEFESAPRIEPTQALHNKLRSMAIAFAKARAR